MVRIEKFNTDNKLLKSGITTEYDAQPGLYNPGCQWVASGVLEWVKNNFYCKETASDSIYERMIGDGEKIPPGCNGVYVNPHFFADTGQSGQGAIMGLDLQTSREAIYRAALEGLTCKLKKYLNILEDTCGFSSESIIVVGGGSKNRLWNQIRADMLGKPIKLIDQKETTVLGAALFAFSGIGEFETPELARSAINYNAQIIEPKTDGSEYNEVFERFLEFNI
jgi:L-fuculokinase